MSEIEYAAALHDIGKIGVADSILRKAGPLDEDEWKEMRRHSELGYEILKSINFFRNAAEIVYAHHEFFDGTGYPRGLAGEEIPLGARVFAVVDAYDAMTSRRPYRMAMSRDAACPSPRTLPPAALPLSPTIMQRWFGGCPLSRPFDLLHRRCRSKGHGDGRARAHP